MKRTLQIIAPSLIVVMAVMLLTPSTSYATGAGQGVAQVSGGGTINPGLSNPPASALQTGTFGGTLNGEASVTKGEHHHAVFTGAPCSFNFASTIAENTAVGQGTASGGCAGPATITVNGAIDSGTASINCVLIYVRVGSIVVIVAIGSCQMIMAPNNHAHISCNSCSVAGVFVFIPNNSNPVTSYALHGAAVIVCVDP